MIFVHSCRHCRDFRAFVQARAVQVVIRRVRSRSSVVVRQNMFGFFPAPLRRMGVVRVRRLANNVDSAFFPPLIDATFVREP